MMNPYENQYIGAFIYALGFKEGQQGSSGGLNRAVNLLQQTGKPDATFGDLIFQSAQTGFLIEFKRTEEDVKEEFAKETKKHLRDELASTSDEIKSISRQAHFLAYGKSIDGTEATLEFSAYLDKLWEQADAARDPQFTPKIVPLSMFLDGILEHKYGARIPEFRRYLKRLAEWGSGSAGGLIVSVQADGKLQFITVEDLAELDLALEQIKANALEHERQQDRSGPSMER